MGFLTRENIGLGQSVLVSTMTAKEITPVEELIQAEEVVGPISLLPGWEAKPQKMLKWLIPVGIVVGGLILLRR